MKNYHKRLCILVLLFLSATVYAGQIQVNSLAYDARQGRLSVAVSASPKHRVFVMDNPSRLVIDIKNANWVGALSQPPAAHPLFAKVKLAAQNAAGLRLVVDLKKPVSPEKFSLTSNNRDEHRLMVNLASKTGSEADTVKTKVVKPAKQVTKTKSTKSIEQKSVANKGRDIIVAIDAGHGGNDPGAHGQQGTEEKVVTMAIAQKLAALLNAQAGLKAVMVRKDDYYVGLRERIQIARAAKADLFISIHADAFNDTTVRGASVFTLSTQGASTEAARWLEKSENAAELVGGVSLSDKEDVLASVLLDLSQSATLSASQQVAQSVLKHFHNISPLHRDSVQKAGFIVLKSPDIPSILVETAFISNPLEEQNLLSPRYQTQMAKAIFKGVYDYFKESAPVDSRMAAL
ncbi:MAG: N-acetylmuramoyl-L-alanine amidase [Methylovulum sp.]|uniref:N-acetylmuramoyl-L-alanine amidase n=1 Tax=Methylovulum sp. TaxID=1916980 RepID=UPI0026052745|nr:N-acetylmuramoyl-L-alanine amidase [Methylovulum sp.]MDD2724850.1 N-acetylmuramoyl-L-alanine amidase [Methylovulum sp.]MDD5126189.1 N-acetylmuramoyl-L-alanine amidase [Methylovulum sp.]